VARSRYRSVRFDLEAAIALARIVDHAGGTITPDLLAAGLDYSGTNNGTYLTRLANARTFGLVAGRGERIDLTDRGRLILAGDEPLASESRRQAFLAVPLFRAVYESRPGGALAGRADLADLLCQEFGESVDKAPVVAAKLLDSARQAGLTRPISHENPQLRAPMGNFTTGENRRPDALRRRVVKFGRTQTAGLSPVPAGVTGGDMDDAQMWLDEGPDDHDPSTRRPPAWRRAGVVAAAVACLVVVGVPLGVAFTGASSPTALTHQHHAKGAKTLGSGPAEHEVLGALSATTDAGNYDFTYTLKATPPTQSVPTTTPTTICPVSSFSSSPQGGAVVVPNGPNGGVVNPGGPADVTGCVEVTPINNPGTPVAGNGVANTNPQASLINATLDGNGLQVSLRVNSTTLYEDLSALQTGLAPSGPEANDPGQAISSFASITESTIGMREGAVAMIGLASPTGYLDLYQQDIEGAAQSGTSTIDGDPVTVYQVAVDPTQLVNAPNITPEEAKTATAAIAVLHNQGYTGTTDEISVDRSGFIREVDTVAHFSDGGTVLLNVSLTNFGCAGTVLMPGQQGSNDPPSGCTSPDTGQAPATTVPSSTTTTPASTTTTTEVPPTPTTTDPSQSTTSTDAHSAAGNGTGTGTTS
jgi:hypothetical protein